MKRTRRTDGSNGRSLDAQSWRQHLEGWRSSSMTQTAYCHEYGLSRDAFQYWKRRLKETAPANRFVEVSLPMESISASATSIEILVGPRFRVQVPAGIQSEHLRTVLAVLAEL